MEEAVDWDTVEDDVENDRRGSGGEGSGFWRMSSGH